MTSVNIIFPLIFFYFTILPTKVSQGVSTSTDMVNNLRLMGIIRNAKVKSALQAIDRADYVEEYPYKNRPYNISGTSTVVPGPVMSAYILEALHDELRDGGKALDVGSGSGYITALLAHMLGEAGAVVGVEHNPEMIDIAMFNVGKSQPNYLSEGRVKFLLGDGRLGVVDEAPYDVIHVGGISTKPRTQDNLIQQLKPGGRMIIPLMSGSTSVLVQMDKNVASGEISRKTILVGLDYTKLMDDPLTKFMKMSGQAEGGADVHGGH